MKGGGRREHDELPVFDADAPPGRPHLSAPVAGAGRGGSRGSGISSGRAAAIGSGLVLALLVAGIGLGGLPSDPGPTSSPDGSPLAVASARTRDPSASHDACRPPTGSVFPPLTIGVAGSRTSVAGLFGFGYRPGAQTSIPGWLLANPPQALVAAPGSELHVSAGTETCLRHLVIERVLTALLGTPVPTTMFRADVAPAAHDVAFDGLPEGDWVVRVTAHFAVSEGDLVSVTYFRVLTGKGAFATNTPAPRPAVTPTVPCGSNPPSETTPALLIVDGSPPVPGAVGQVPPATGAPAAIPIVHLGLGATALLAIESELCAVGWDIQLSDSAGETSMSVGYMENPAGDPGVAAQNRWTIRPDGDQTLTAGLRLAGGPEILRTWRIVVDPFRIPDAYVIGADGSKVAAGPGCGLSLALANRYTASDSCGSLGFPTGLSTLRVKAYQPVRFVIPGWELVSWSGLCGSVAIQDGAEQFIAPAACGLGGASSDQDQLNRPLIDPAVFVVPPGRYVLQLFVGALRNGDRFSVPFYALVDAR